ncbi:hypothetical protein A3B05_00450 [Candidatus Giovannonibacteria bacterium RIFCSPLOWO2_01_FULL_43_160]|uniref:Uncharacterized protein n=2 Tax=Candidatus Giovannoniibacteriota TaxID=1752738 RepID=A0A0G1IT00_9BACT|nr:MAG: hypothetical protein UV72_C0014G0023 [Candidatus Giovannonibacteria bacterium GW2011_GWB1_43_13]KKS99131.1 MAG: hypothetical protein UV75_C0009G0015 [Candidatus Giovannonibacteria bacterium GW2011_GWA1_43_15]KKT62048.1 MAG: hypothetical protein UW55_C0018G0015 [Candidatus Giovannonibacteria bacterium GW2011_GWA2_44_26]OGF58322.1 MAG: hypothetical protein A2652_01285 [Candidatus Giovannonibacteria bacterium RIFCSPHIGHO2_01_FULL_43_140]OGF70110.1 MAG: hypothetical protein A3C76_02780 [Can
MNKKIIYYALSIMPLLIAGYFIIFRDSICKLAFDTGCLTYFAIFGTLCLVFLGLASVQKNKI